MPPLRLPPISDDGLGADPLRAPVLVAFVLAGLALVAAQLPHGRFFTVGLAGIGALVAAACWFASQRPILPMVATSLNGVILFVAFMLPSWIGLDSWRPRADWKGGAIVKAIGPDGAEAPAGEWVPGDYSWQLNDVRMRLAAVSIGPVELSGSGGRKVSSKKQYLQIRVHVSNAGGSRDLTFKGWDLSPMPGSAVPRLVDSAGHVLPIALVEAGGESLVRAAPANLSRGDAAEQLFLFEPPAATIDYLRLELPPSAYGGFQPIRFQIAATQITNRPPK